MIKRNNVIVIIIYFIRRGPLYCRFAYLSFKEWGYRKYFILEAYVMGLEGEGQKFFAGIANEII